MCTVSNIFTIYNYEKKKNVITQPMIGENRQLGTNEPVEFEK